MVQNQSEFRRGSREDFFTYFGSKIASILGPKVEKKEYRKIDEKSGGWEAGKRGRQAGGKIVPPPPQVALQVPGAEDHPPLHDVAQRRVADQRLLVLEPGTQFPEPDDSRVIPNWNECHSFRDLTFTFVAD